MTSCDVCRWWKAQIHAARKDHELRLCIIIKQCRSFLITRNSNIEKIKILKVNVRLLFRFCGTLLPDGMPHSSPTAKREDHRALPPAVIVYRFNFLERDSFHFYKCLKVVFGLSVVIQVGLSRSLKHLFYSYVLTCFLFPYDATSVLTDHKLYGLINLTENLYTKTGDLNNFTIGQVAVKLSLLSGSDAGTGL